MHSENTDIEIRAKVSVAVLPGLFAVIWHLQITDLIPLGHKTILLLLLSFCIGGMFCVKDRKLSVWSFPSLGALLWLGGIWLPEVWQRWGRKGWGWIIESFYSGFYSIAHVDPFWFFNIAVAILMILITVWIYLQFQLQLQRHEYMGIGLLGLVTLIYTVSLCILTPIAWSFLFLQMTMNFIFLLMITIIGLQFTRHDTLKAALLVAVCEPLWIMMILRLLPPDMYLFPVGNSHMNISVLLMLILPPLSFIVVIPFGLLLTHSKQKQIVWLILSSALTLSTLLIVAVSSSQETVIEIPFDFWALKSLLALQIWTPILTIAGSLYDQKKLQHTQK